MSDNPHRDPGRPDTSLPQPLIVPGFIDAATCQRIRAAMDRGAAAPAEIFDHGYVVDDFVRHAFDVDVDEATLVEVEALLARARQRLAAHINGPLQYAAGAGFLRYGPGGHYLAHRDSDPDLVDLRVAADAAVRAFSAVLFLNTATAVAAGDDCSGGTLRIYPASGVTSGDALDVAPKTGTLVLFAATRLHEVLPVTGGLRDVVVDWFS
ncbi:MAG: 2OG-Fe(II) oxygenase [Acidobacteriota bacterium]